MVLELLTKLLAQVVEWCLTNIARLLEGRNSFPVKKRDNVLPLLNLGVKVRIRSNPNDRGNQTNWNEVFRGGDNLTRESPEEEVGITPT